jgi:hypothetical protein
MTITSRRRILTTAAALAGAAAVNVSSVSSDTVDAELRALGLELETLIREWHARQAIDRRVRAGEVPDSDPESEGWTDFHDRMYPVCDRILACRPQTIAGLGVQARAISLTEEGWWDGDWDEHGPENYTRDFVASVCAFAGVRTVNAEEKKVRARMFLGEQSAHTDSYNITISDPVFTAIERCRRQAAACDVAANAEPEDEDAMDAAADEMWEARMAMAQTVPTTWVGFTALITFVAEQTAMNASHCAFQESEEAALHSISLGQAIERLSHHG